jgi:hypothetical protein
MSIYIILGIASVFPFNIAAVLDRNVVRFVDDYYTHQKVRVITTFTCSTYGTVFNYFPVVLKNKLHITHSHLNTNTQTITQSLYQLDAPIPLLFI